MNDTSVRVPARQAAANGLAIVGFIALIALGLFLAVSASRFVPGIVNGLGSAAVYLGSVFTPGSPAPVVSTSMPDAIWFASFCCFSVIKDRFQSYFNYIVLFSFISMTLIS